VRTGNHSDVGDASHPSKGKDYLDSFRDAQILCGIVRAVVAHKKTPTA